MQTRLDSSPKTSPLPGSPSTAVKTEAPPPARAALFTDGVDAPSEVAGRPLPPRVVELKRQILALTSENTLRTDNVKQVRAQLDPLVDELEAWFAANRPANEVAITRGAWRSLWYDDANIDRDSGVFRLDRDQIYQVVRDGYYYNVADNPVVLFGKRVGTTHSFLEGRYDVVDRATPARAGEERLNVVDLQFGDNGIRLGKIPRGQDLQEMVDAVDAGDRFTIPVPGPKGITGQLWNAYVDKDLRISRGQQDDDPGVTDLYVLRRVRAAED